MEFLTAIWGTGYGFLSYLVPFVFVLTIVVFFHELGHFGIARLFGTKIDAFSIGFGKEIFGWFDKHGTRWKVCWIPLGGYVKFFGDEDAASTPDQKQLEEERARMTEEEQAQCFHFKPLYQRAAIVAAGPFANFIPLDCYLYIFLLACWPNDYGIARRLCHRGQCCGKHAVCRSAMSSKKLTALKLNPLTRWLR